jgi:uncharacterized membrane protein YkoI
MPNKKTISCLIILAGMLISFGLISINITSARTIIIPEEVTEQSCDAMNPCSEGLECYSFPGIGLRCAELNPCSYYQCSEITQCTVVESYPAQVRCSCVGPECSASADDEQTISYDISTQAVIQVKDQNQQSVSRNISLWKATVGNEGILKTNSHNIKYSNKLMVEDSKLFMETSAGNKLINILPEDAIKIPSMPTKETIKDIELKEEKKKPVYHIESVKRAKLFFIFPVSVKIETKIDAEAGKIVSVKKPWWSFIAR